MKKLIIMILFFSIPLLLFSGCQPEEVTTTVTSTTTSIKSTTITQTLPASTVTEVSTVKTTVTDTVTMTPSTTSSTSSSTTTSQTAVPDYKIVDGLITSQDDKLQILSHRMDYGITPGLRIQLKNIGTSVVSAEIVVEIMHNFGPEQITEIVSDLQPGEIRNVSILVVGYYDTTYEIIVLRTIT